MKVNYEGCAICDSTWGNVWEKVEGTRLFFCCSLCALQFRGLVERIKASTGWTRIDTIEIRGDRSGRTCRAGWKSSTAEFSFAFNSEGKLRRFARTTSGPTNS